MNGLALCAGVAGIELGLKIALGESYRTVCYVELEAYSAAVNVARMEDSALDLAPIWDRVETFDGRPWRGVVDIISAGFPCQPYSVAGKRQGEADERWLWPHIDRIIREVGPRFVLLENVPGIFASGLGSVFGSLADSGFNAEWDVFSAAGVGAPHLRRRVFIFAYANSDRFEWPRIHLRSRKEGESKAEFSWNGQAIADPARAGLSDLQGGGPPAEPPGGRLSLRSDSEGAFQDAGSIGRDPLGSSIPGHEGWRAFPCHSGWWATEPNVGRVVHRVPFRVDSIRALGNGVVPLVAAVAIKILSWRVNQNG